MEQSVLSHLEVYPEEKFIGSLGVEFVTVIDNIARRQLHLKQYVMAEKSYQRAFAILLANKSYDADAINKLRAGIYNQLGNVAQEQRQWEQAEQYYQQALQICIEYNDRYELAKIYYQLGTVAEQQQQWEQACDYSLRSLEIVITYDDPYHQRMVLKSLARLWKSSSDANLPVAVAAILGTNGEETEKLFRDMLEDE